MDELLSISYHKMRTGNFIYRREGPEIRLSNGTFVDV